MAWVAVVLPIDPGDDDDPGAASQAPPIEGGPALQDPVSGRAAGGGLADPAVGLPGEARIVQIGGPEPREQRAAFAVQPKGTREPLAAHAALSARATRSRCCSILADQDDVAPLEIVAERFHRSAVCLASISALGTMLARFAPTT